MRASCSWKRWPKAWRPSRTGRCSPNSDAASRRAIWSARRCRRTTSPIASRRWRAPALSRARALPPFRWASATSCGACSACCCSPARRCSSSTRCCSTTRARSLEQMQDNSLQRLRALKAVSDGYGLDVVDTTFRVRNDLMTVGQGRRDDRCGAGQDRPQLGRAGRRCRAARSSRRCSSRCAARARGDAAMDDPARDPRAARHAALGHFADTELYPAIDPVTTRMEALSDLAMRRCRTPGARRNRTRAAREHVAHRPVAVSRCCSPRSLARRILRNAYKGVESLTQLARDMRKHEPDDRYPASARAANSAT